MARKIIDIGAVGNDGTGDSIRDSFRKVNDNFRELYSSLGLGERLRFIGLDDAPATYVGQNDATTGSTSVETKQAPLVSIKEPSKESELKTLAKTMIEFGSTCESLKELGSFWKHNQSKIDEMKSQIGRAHV